LNLDLLFYPKSVAVVGASNNFGGGRMPFFQVLQLNGFQGTLYPINPKSAEVSGVKAYASIDELPEPVDLAIVAAPVEHSIDIVKAAVRKQIKFIHFFTSGFGETGKRQLEEDMIKEARKGDLRIVGPNCIGVFCAESRMTFAPSAHLELPGTVAFLAQSGGVTNDFLAQASTRKIPINKIVSYGNQIDLRLEDYLAYLADDVNVRLIACYVEDIKNTAAFLDTLSQTTDKKPVIILKGGKTETGARAAASHTGAMASNYTIWSAAVRQHGGLLVENFDQLMHLVMLSTAKKFPGGKRVGFLGAGGGNSVLFSDLAAESGLVLPELSASSQKMISEKIVDVNTSTLNPVDLGAFGFDFNVMLHTMKALDQDNSIDVIMPYFSVEYILMSEVALKVKNNDETILEMAEHIEKPVIPILSNFVEDNIDVERTRISTFAALRKAGFPVYAKMQDAIYSLNTYLEWVAKKDRLKNARSAERIGR